jgi:cell division protease FtsH
LSRFPRSSLFYFALVVVLGLVFWFTWQSLQSGQNATDWHFSKLMSAAQSGEVKSLEINGTDGIAMDTSGKKHNVVLPDPSGNAPYLTELRDKGVDVWFDKNNSGSYLLSVLLPNIILVILIAAFMWWVLRQTQSGNNQAISFGRSRARLIAGDKPAITFADVAGVEEAKPECRSSRSPVRSSSRWSSVSARAAFGTSSTRPRRTRPASSSSMRSTPSDASVGPGSVAVTMSASRPSTSCSSRWTDSIRTPT